MRSLTQENVKRQDSLRYLIMVTSLLTKARSTNDKNLYRALFAFAKEIEEYFPNLSMMHYVLGVTRLNGWADRDYAIEKWGMISSQGPAFSFDLAEILRKEIDLFTKKYMGYQDYSSSARLAANA